MRRTWRCFHCDEVFQTERGAEEHFGGTRAALAGCQIKGHEHSLLTVIRDQEAELVRHREEDTELTRAMQSLKCEHERALRRAEELGFGRGVKEMQRLASEQFGREVAL